MAWYLGKYRENLPLPYLMETEAFMTPNDTFISCPWESVSGYFTAGPTLSSILNL